MSPSWIAFAGSVGGAPNGVSALGGSTSAWIAFAASVGGAPSGVSALGGNTSACPPGGGIGMTLDEEDADDARAPSGISEGNTSADSLGASGITFGGLGALGALSSVAPGRTASKPSGRSSSPAFAASGPASPSGICLGTRNFWSQKHLSVTLTAIVATTMNAANQVMAAVSDEKPPACAMFKLPHVEVVVVMAPWTMMGSEIAVTTTS
mmetsp:Transcript_116863/g.302971  ORF Transcript_116863/g.302971 Transcript_116863/m.302971 type:complete len:209 (-) Transcript_116863:1343-1969(-)